MSFPLYDLLLNDSKNMSNLLADQKKEIIDNIKLLDQDGLDNLYLLIRYSARKNNDEKVFNAKYQRKGVVFKLDGLPEDLQKIIFLFLKRHVSHMKQTGVEIILD